MSKYLREIITYSDTDIKNILNCVCTIAGITIEELLSKNRRRSYVNARRVASILMLKKYLVTTTKAGIYLLKDHSSIVFYRNSHDNLYKFDRIYANLYDTCEKALGIADIKKTDVKYIDYVDTLIVRIEQLSSENEEYREQILKLKEIING